MPKPLAGRGASRDVCLSDVPRVAVFDPTVHEIEWTWGDLAGEQAEPSLLGYLEVLDRFEIPYAVVDPRTERRLNQRRLVVMPWPVFVDPKLAEDLLGWVRDGGTLLVESELDAYDERGVYRLPTDRPFANALGIRSLGRRAAKSPSMAFHLGIMRGAMSAGRWIEAFATPGGHEPHALDLTADRGRVVALGTLAGEAQRNRRSDGFERLVVTVARASGATSD